jgi:hypothetical protein
VAAQKGDKETNKENISIPSLGSINFSNFSNISTTGGPNSLTDLMHDVDEHQRRTTINTPPLIVTATRSLATATVTASQANNSSPSPSPAGDETDSD